MGTAHILSVLSQISGSVHAAWNPGMWRGSGDCWVSETPESTNQFPTLLKLGCGHTYASIHDMKLEYILKYLI